MSPAASASLVAEKSKNHAFCFSRDARGRTPDASLQYATIGKTLSVTPPTKPKRQLALLFNLQHLSAQLDSPRYKARKDFRTCAIVTDNSRQVFLCMNIISLDIDAQQ